MARINLGNGIVEYTLEEWAEFDGYEIEEAREVYSSTINGSVAVKIYADEESAVCGVEYEDGTFGIFGAGMDEDGLTKDEMYTGIAAGY